MNKWFGGFICQVFPWVGGRLQVSSPTTAALLFPRISIIRTFHGILAVFPGGFFCFYNNHGSVENDGKWLNLKGSYRWRDPFFTSMKIGRKCKTYPFLVVFTKLFVSEERVASASFRVPSNVDRHEGFFSAQRSRDSTDSKNSTSFGRIPNSLSENLARQIEWYSIYMYALQGVFVYYIDALRASGESTRCRHQLAHLEGWVNFWKVYIILWLLASWRECMCSSTQFMWLFHSKPESIWSNAAWSGGVCLHESYVTMHHGFSLWHWMVCDLVRRRRKLMVCGWSNELLPYCLFFWGGGMVFFKMTKNDKWRIKCMMTSSLWLQPNRVIITAVVAKILIWILYKHDLIDLKLFRKLYM